VAGDPIYLSLALSDWTNWPRTFTDTIEAVRPVAVGPNWVQIEVGHRSHGSVTNWLTFEADGVILLRESKPLYDAEFRFEPVHASSAGLSVVARIWLKRGLRVFAIAAPPIVRSRMKRYLLEPLTHRAAELGAVAIQRDRNAARSISATPGPTG
jgi:hypothetical protein